ncbi:MAG: hypothetical protein JWM11_276 [Planctomycetaceae bacterium]|nr:hypothetical protein [Planctomycetaceae bacterium]
MDILVRHTLRPVNQLPMQNDLSGIGCSIAGGRQMVQIKSILLLTSIPYLFKNLCFICVNLWLNPHFVGH